MLITGLSYDPTYYGKNTFMAFPTYVNQVTQKGAYSVDTEYWFAGSYTYVNQVTQKGSFSVDTENWFAGSYSYVNQVFQKGNVAGPDVPMLVSKETKQITFDDVPVESIKSNLLNIRGGRLQRNVTFLPPPVVAIPKEIEVDLSFITVKPTAPYAWTEDVENRQLQYDINSLDLSGVPVILAKSEFVAGA